MTTCVALGLAGLAGMGLLVWAALARPAMDLAFVVPERYRTIEAAQVVLWVLVGVVASVGCARQRVRRGALLGLWLAVLALFAGLRELDLHAVLNPPNIHLLGLEEDQAVRFRLDWWTDGDVSGRLRLAWAGVLLALAALPVVPFALARYPWGKRLLARRPFAWLIVGGLGTLGLAYVGDDLLRPVLQAAGASLDLGEESVELVGQGLILAGAGLLVFRRVDLTLPGRARAGSGSSSDSGNTRRAEPPSTP